MAARVLILCTGNSCRSQMAEGVLRHYGSDKFEVFSAGLEPREVHPNAVKVMKEIGIDISGQRSKNVKDFLGQGFQYIITVCDNANQHCPIFPGAAIRIHWPFPDPPRGDDDSEASLDRFREVRDMIVAKFRKFAETGKA